MSEAARDDLLDPKEAADYTRLSRSMIYKLCDERRLAHVRIGAKGKRGKVLIYRQDLDRLLEENRIEVQ